MHRRASAWFGASFLLACAGSLSGGALIRDHLRAGQTYWVISRTVFLVRDQHLAAPFRFLSPTMTLAVWPLFAIAVVILIRSVRLGSPGLPAFPEIVAGLYTGGGLANAVEAQVFGSVTDFLAIDRSGIYSAGDIAVDVASSLLPSAAIQIARAQHRPLPQVLLVGGVFYAVVVLFAVVSHDYALAVLVTLAIVGSAASLLTKRVAMSH